MKICDIKLNIDFQKTMGELRSQKSLIFIDSFILVVAKLLITTGSLQLWATVWHGIT